jgi:putative Mg2+ transporter-C (MgtC) family protein
MFGEWGYSLGHLVHLLAAFLLALPIGWNRPHRAWRRDSHLPAGGDGELRLCPDRDFGPGRGCRDPSQHLARGHTGVGFIGAGAIMWQGEATTGNATAASIWTVGVIGAAVGFGYFDIGLILAAANLAVLRFRKPLAGGRVIAPGLHGMPDERED